MMAKKTHDLCVKAGTYQKDGETKNRYKNVGMILQNDNGGDMIMIDPTFNFAAVKEQDRDFVILSKFEVKDDNKPKAAPAAQQFDE
jgi:hypothetical protein